MKKLYEIPAIELTKFDVEDVITASSGIAYDTNQAAFMTEIGANAVVEWRSDWDGYGI